MRFTLMPHQEGFVFDTQHRFVAMKGGYGTGKSQALCYKAILCAKRNPGKLGALLEPVQSMVATDLVPTWENVLDHAIGEDNWTCTSRSHHIYELRFKGQAPTRIMLLGAENYNRLRGKNMAFMGVDEFDTIKPQALQTAVLEMLISRVRTGDTDEQEQLFFVSTPEGFGGMYHFFVEEPERLQREAAALGTTWLPDRKIYTASTRDNYLLKQSYIKSMEQKYPAHLLAAYIEGEFVNLARGSVYPEFDTVESTTELDWRSPQLAASPLQLGIDFNNNAMSVVVGVVQDDRLYIIDEIMGSRGTPSAIQDIKSRDWFRAGRRIYIHPDKTGVANDSTSETSDIILLQQAFGKSSVIIEDQAGRRSNPPIQDRVNSVNARIKNGVTRNLFVNLKTAPQTASALQRQTFNEKGQPTKDGKLDGPADAVGYLVWSFWPILAHHWHKAGKLII